MRWRASSRASATSSPRLKCLGAPADFAVLVYLIEILVIAALGRPIGLAVGAAIPFVADALPHGALAGPACRRLSGRAGARCRLRLADRARLRALSRSAGRARSARRRCSATRSRRPRMRPRTAYLVAPAVSAAALARACRRPRLRPAHRRASSSSRRPAPSSCSGRSASRPCGWRAACRGGDRPMLRLALGNIHRPGALTAVGRPLARPRPHARGRAGPDRRQFPPRAFRRDPARCAELLLPRHPATAIATPSRPWSRAPRPTPSSSSQPMLRGRLVKPVRGVPAEKAAIDPEVRWVLEGDRGITYAAATAAGQSQLVAGAWWPQDYDGPPLVSFDRKIAEGLRLKLGDTVTVNVLGREVTRNGRQSSARSSGSRCRINSVMIFSPNTFRGAPFGSSRRSPFRTAARSEQGARAPQDGHRGLPGDHRGPGQGGGRDRQPARRARSAGRCAALRRSP